MTTNLKQQIEETLKSTSSKYSKVKSIVRLGLLEREARQIVDKWYKENGDIDVDALTFGVEIECYNIERERLIHEMALLGVQCESEVYNHVTKQYFKIVSDASIEGNDPLECVL